ncbi:hypothetical protein [Candidatus Nephthysia bennettiae]|uniref:Uncharacterized protein n=1 Tax=Candidatus Nephthysia bennettiae TaxID=3127016 RepID=A0A934KDH0_9BACT|nr:hypothetical protein [Candidatus Dormibacteraeota bacterium]
MEAALVRFNEGQSPDLQTAFVEARHEEDPDWQPFTAEQPVADSLPLPPADPPPAAAFSEDRAASAKAPHDPRETAELFAEAAVLKRQGLTGSEAFLEAARRPPRQRGEIPRPARLAVEMTARMAEQTALGKPITGKQALNDVVGEYLAETEDAEAATAAERERRLADNDAIVRRMGELVREGGGNPRSYKSWRAAFDQAGREAAR